MLGWERLCDVAERAGETVRSGAKGAKQRDKSEKQGNCRAKK